MKTVKELDPSMVVQIPTKTIVPKFTPFKPGPIHLELGSEVKIMNKPLWDKKVFVKNDNSAFKEVTKETPTINLNPDSLKLCPLENSTIGGEKTPSN